jgi:hypothetical protein
MDNAVGIANSEFLSFAGYRITNATTTGEAYGFTDGEASTTCSYNVAIMLDRVEDPTAMLAGDWASRQAALADPDLWTNYGADPTTYAMVVQALVDAGLTLIENNSGGNNGFYTSSVENRTIWVQLNSAEDFNTLFGTGPGDQVLQYSPSADIHFWDSELALPEEWGVVGLWFDVQHRAPAENLGSSPPVTLPTGSPSPGNRGDVDVLSPQDIAKRYNFPLDGQNVATDVIGLIEPGAGSAVPGDASGAGFQALLTAYLDYVGVNGTGQVSVQGIDGQQAPSSGERSGDVGIVAAINPNSDLQLFTGSGRTFDNAGSSVFTAIQASIWNSVNGVLPPVVSSSYDDVVALAPGSPYSTAYRQLFIDAALMNQTNVIAVGDGGSGGEIGNGLNNVQATNTQPYNILVGGTSLSSQAVAATDQTLADYYGPALQGDLGMLAQLIKGGLRTLPSSTSDIDHFIETVWNQYRIASDTITGYTTNSAGAGGVDTTQGAAPWYQTEYGLNPVTSDSLAQPGRGVPDVSANSDGNMGYFVPAPDMTIVEDEYFGGTSAAAPLWASLITQYNYIFRNQGLNNLGFMNDLLYIAAAVAPGSFNDITIGNNNSTFYYDAAGAYSIDGTQGSPTDLGYSAGNGYDYVSGLGTPNGVLLGRALTAIAHAQTSFGDALPVLDSDGSGGWLSGADQTLLFQTVASDQVAIGIDIDGSDIGFLSGATQSYAWTARLAQQVLQSDFDPNLVRLFDGAGQGAIVDSFVGGGDSFSVSLAGNAGNTPQADLTSDYGFVDFARDGNNVRVARAVAVAETAGGADDQMAVVRVRQNGQDSISVSFYQVDDLAGTIGGLSPGQAGYAAAAQAAAYQLFTGGTVMNGPGYGNYTQSLLMDVDAGDYIAMSLTNSSSGFAYWAFSQANPDGQAHLWSYGLNTWGWEDLWGGGDRDFNDLIVQLDFTSASGDNLLV